MLCTLNSTKNSEKTKEVKKEERIYYVLGLLPDRIKEKIMRLSSAGAGGVASLREIRLRRFGRASVTLGRERVYIREPLSKEEMEKTVKLLTEDALYAHREDICAGFISLKYGIRVGVAGTAAYDGGRLVGISDISSLLVRIPTGECSFGGELFEIYKSSVSSGMLIYSPPGLGKTTALRSLAHSLGNYLSVAVIDERREFAKEDYASLCVDILSGYKKSAGLEIAIRTLAPDVVMIDEIGADEAEVISRVITSGVPVVATAHAPTLSSLLAKPSLLPLLSLGVFDVFVGILPEGRLSVDKA